jgi:hypothetical protein
MSHYTIPDNGHIVITRPKAKFENQVKEFWGEHFEYPISDFDTASRRTTLFCNKHNQIISYPKPLDIKKYNPCSLCYKENMRSM